MDVSERAHRAWHVVSPRGTLATVICCHCLFTWKLHACLLTAEQNPKRLHITNCEAAVGPGHRHLGACHKASPEDPGWRDVVVRVGMGTNVPGNICVSPSKKVSLSWGLMPGF